MRHQALASTLAVLAVAVLGQVLTSPMALATEQPGNWVGQPDTNYRRLNIGVFYYGCVLMDLPDEKGEYSFPLAGKDAGTASQGYLAELAMSPESQQAAMDQELQRIRRQMDDCARFYWRNSRFNCVLSYDWRLDFTPTLRSSIAASDAPYYGPVEVDPVAKARANYDGVVQIVVLYAWDKESGVPKRVRGGGGFTWGADGKRHLAPVSWWAAPPQEHVCGSDWLMCHEFGHGLDSLFHESGIREHWFNHLALSEGNVARFAEHFDAMSYILRRCKEQDWAGLKWGEWLQYQDVDTDGMPDYDLDLDALALATDPDNTKGDSDGDGLSDRAETLWGNGNFEGHGERLHSQINYPIPWIADIDGDGLPDGADEYPTLPLRGKVGIQTLPPGWLEDHKDETAESNSFVPDPLAELYVPPDVIRMAPDLAIQLGYAQDKELQVTLLWPRDDKMHRLVEDPTDCELRLNFDFDNDGWFSGTDNYRIELDREGVTKVMRNEADSHSEWPKEILDAVKPEQVGFEKLGPQGVFAQGVRLTINHSIFPELACKPGEEFGCNIGIRYRGQPKYEMISDPNGLLVFELR